MENKQVPEITPPISRLGFGCSSFWAKETFPEAEALSLLMKAYQKGINYFDTGSSYAGGNAEKRLGQFLRKVNRERLIISTKAGTVQASMGNAKKDFSPKAITDSVNESLRRLNTSYIDILYLHSPQIKDITSDLIDALANLKKNGKVKHIGVHSSQLSVLNELLPNKIFTFYLSDYNVMTPYLRDFIFQVNALGKFFVAATPLAQMLFTNKVLLPRSVKDLWYLARALKNRRHHLLNGFKLRYLNSYEYKPNEIALNYVLNNPGVLTCVFGTTSESHLVSNINALEVNIPEYIFDRVNGSKLAMLATK